MRLCCLAWVLNSKRKSLVFWKGQPHQAICRLSRVFQRSFIPIQQWPGFLMDRLKCQMKLTALTQLLMIKWWNQHRGFFPSSQLSPADEPSRCLWRGYAHSAYSFTCVLDCLSEVPAHQHTQHGKQEEQRSVAVSQPWSCGSYRDMGGQLSWLECCHGHLMYL